MILRAALPDYCLRFRPRSSFVSGRMKLPARRVCQATGLVEETCLLPGTGAAPSVVFLNQN